MRFQPERDGSSGDGFRTSYRLASRFFAGELGIVEGARSKRGARHAKQTIGLAHALLHWARVAVQHDPASRAKYRALRARGKSWGRALRGVSVNRTCPVPQRC
jgi:hypothetical protein